MYQHFLEFIALWMGVDTLHVYSNKGTCYLTSLRSNKISQQPKLRPYAFEAWSQSSLATDD